MKLMMESCKIKPHEAKLLILSWMMKVNGADKEVLDIRVKGADDGVLQH